MIKTNIKMRVTPEQLQNIAVILNVAFFNYEHKYIVLLEKDRYYLSICKKYFKTLKYKEVDADLFIRTNGTCEENKKTFDSFNVESISNFILLALQSENILLKKKIKNLHIALNKKVAKNKNQALEIKKLLEQKKDLQEINDTQNEYIRQIERDIAFKVEESKQLQKENSFVKSEHNKIIEKLNESRKETTILENIRYNLEKQLKEKDTIISYLESKLK